MPEFTHSSPKRVKAINDDSMHSLKKALYSAQTEITSQIESTVMARNMSFADGAEMHVRMQRVFNREVRGLMRQIHDKY